MRKTFLFDFACAVVKLPDEEETQPVGNRTAHNQHIAMQYFSVLGMLETEQLIIIAIPVQLKGPVDHAWGIISTFGTS